MNTIIVLAMKAFKDGIRNRWVLAITTLFTLFALTLVFLGSAPIGETKAGPIAVIVVSLASLNIFLFPLIALLLAYDTLIGEIEHGTMMLLLSYPLSRWQVVVGKFLGQCLILAVATIVSYALTAVVLAIMHRQLGFDWAVWLPYIRMSLSTIVLAAAFLAIGYLISVIAHERSQAAGMAIGVWLILVIVYDIALLGTLIVDKGRHITEHVLAWLLWLNPADSYRLFNLSSDGSATVAGMLNVGQSMSLQPALLMLSLCLWIALPLTFTILIFRKKAL